MSPGKRWEFAKVQELLRVKERRRGYGIDAWSLKKQMSLSNTPKVRERAVSLETLMNMGKTSMSF